MGAKTVLRKLAVLAFTLSLCLGAAPRSQSQEKLAIAPDSTRWRLDGNAKVSEYLGRKCLMMDGAAAVLKDFEMRDGVLDVDVVTSAKRGFFGFDVRIDKEEANFEEIYLRPHKSGLPDAMQYTPVLNSERDWQIYNGTGFTGNVEIPKGEWFHLRLELAGAQGKLFVGDMEKPALAISDFKSGVKGEGRQLFNLTGAKCY